MLNVKDLHKTYVTTEGSVQAVRNVSFEVNKGQFFTLLGPSGCGKSTTLRCVAGLEVPDQGKIWIGDKAVCIINGSKRTLIPAHKRGVGMVFQSYAIWPHLTVFGNVAFPLIYGGGRMPRSQIEERVRNALKLVRLEHLEKRPAPFLSGGQQQRVALARALIYQPGLLLLDEPLSNLDAKLRLEMRHELRELVDRLEITTLYVTHDQEEALAMSDRIALMQEGTIVEEGDPRKIYDRPDHPLTASSIGDVNRLEGEVTRGGPGEKEAAVLTSLGEILCSLPETVGGGNRVTLMFRPEDIVLLPNRCEQGTNLWTGTIQNVVYLGKRMECGVLVGEELFQCEAGSHLALERGQTVSVEIPPERIRVFRNA